MKSFTVGLALIIFILPIQAETVGRVPSVLNEKAGERGQQTDHSALAAARLHGRYAVTTLPRCDDSRDASAVQWVMQNPGKSICGFNKLIARVDDEIWVLTGTNGTPDAKWLKEKFK